MRKVNRKSGQQMVEVLIGLVALIPVFLFLYDICVVFLVTNMNDGVARDAARAASAIAPASTIQPNPTSKRPLVQSAPNNDRAKGVILLAKGRSRGYISDLQMDPTQSNIMVTAVPDPFTGGSYDGQVTVHTKVTFALPVTFGLLPTQQTMDSAATFPLTAQLAGNAKDLVD